MNSEIFVLLQMLPYAILGLAAILSAYYNRAKLFSVSLAMACVYFIIQAWLQMSLQNIQAWSIYSLLSLAIPLFLMLLNILPERGVRNRHGLLLILLLLVHLILGIGLYRLMPEWVNSIHHLLAVKPIAGYVLSWAGSIAFICSAGVGLFYLCQYNSENAAVTLSVLIYSYVTLVFFDMTDISIAMFSAMSISIVIYLITSSYDMAFRDELTGLKARRALNEAIKGLGKRYTIAMLDVDRFKKLNDTYGHDVGDHVLKMVAKQIAAVKGGGMAYRYGGEEFCVIFSKKSATQCLSYLEDVRIAIKDYQLLLRDLQQRPKSSKHGKSKRGGKQAGSKISVTISIGVASRSEENSTPAEVIKAADEALYQAKKQGRNRVVISGQS